VARTKIKDLHPREAIGHVMFTVLEPYYKAGRKRVRDELSDRRASEATERSSSEMFLNEACFKVMQRAADHVSGDGRLPYSARRLFYAVRDMIREYTANEFSQDNGYQYFQGTILQDYQREYGKLEGLYYDPRGRLHEPHRGKTVDVGTREVESYSFPKHVFNKLLYVEKKGQLPLLQEARTPRGSVHLVGRAQEFNHGDDVAGVGRPDLDPPLPERQLGFIRHDDWLCNASPACPNRFPTCPARNQDVRLEHEFLRGVVLPLNVNALLGPRHVLRPEPAVEQFLANRDESKVHVRP